MASMKEADLVTALKASMQDSASVFTAAEDADFKRFLQHAAEDFSRFKPYRRKESITLVALQADYTAPTGLIHIIDVLYGKSEMLTRKPWEDNYPLDIPTVKKYRTDSATMLILTPAPTAALITNLGTSFEFICSKQHVISDTNPGEAGATTIDEEHRALFLLRSQAEAMKEMAMRNIKKPVSVKDSLNNVTRNGTPAALYDQLIKDFEKLAA